MTIERRVQEKTGHARTCNVMSGIALPGKAVGMAVYFDPAGVCLDAASPEDIIPDTGGIQLVQRWLCRVFVVLRIAVAAHKVLWRVRRELDEHVLLCAGNVDRDRRKLRAVDRVCITSVPRAHRGRSGPFLLRRVHCGEGKDGRWVDGGKILCFYVALIRFSALQLRAENRGCERTRLGRAMAGMGAAWRGSPSDVIGSSRRQPGALPICVAVLLILWVGAPGAGAFKFVYIPCEQDQPMEEWCLTPRGQDDEIGCLTQRLQEWYGKRGLTEEQRAHFKEQVRFHMQQKNPEQKTAELLEPKDPAIADVSDRILSHESVEIVTVLPPMSRFGYVSVSLYVDDKGVARGLPLNHRATSLLETVSTRKGPILGDAFVARTYDNEADEVCGFIRLDLGVADISSSAGWVHRFVCDCVCVCVCVCCLFVSIVSTWVLLRCRRRAGYMREGIDSMCVYMRAGQGVPGAEAA